MAVGQLEVKIRLNDAVGVGQPMLAFTVLGHDRQLDVSQACSCSPRPVVERVGLVLE